jgi:hypothetical protein
VLREHRDPPHIPLGLGHRRLTRQGGQREHAVDHVQAENLLLHQVVVGRSHDRDVETCILAGQLLGILVLLAGLQTLLRESPHRFEREADLVQIRVAAVASRQPRRMALQRETQVAQLAKLLQLDLLHARSKVGLNRHQTIRLQLAQRIPHRRPAHPNFLRQNFRHQGPPRQVFAIEYLFRICS